MPATAECDERSDVAMSELVVRVCSVCCEPDLHSAYGASAALTDVSQPWSCRACCNQEFTLMPLRHEAPQRRRSAR